MVVKDVMTSCTQDEVDDNSLMRMT